MRLRASKLVSSGTIAIHRETVYVKCLTYSKPSKSGTYYYSEVGEGTEAWAT